MFYSTMSFEMSFSPSSVVAKLAGELSFNAETFRFEVSHQVTLILVCLVTNSTSILISQHNVKMEIPCKHERKVICPVTDFRQKKQTILLV